MSDKIIKWDDALKKNKAKKATKKKSETIDLINFYWLSCDSCKTKEYSFTYAPNGRIHNKCGTIIKEEAVKINPNFEYRSALYNAALSQNLLLDDQNLINGDLKDIKDAKKYVEIMLKLALTFIEYCDQKLGLNKKITSLSPQDFKNHVKAAIEQKYQFDSFYFIIGAYLKNLH